MKKFKVIYLDANLIKKDKIVFATCDDVAILKFCTCTSYSKILSVEET